MKSNPLSSRFSSRAFLLLLFPSIFAASLEADPLLSWQRRLNLTLLNYQSGSGEIEILNPSTFRFLRCRSKPCAGRTPAIAEPLPFQTIETTAAFEFKTRYLEIRVRKSDGGLSVTSRHGVEMLNEFVPAGPAKPGIHLEYRSPATERFHGLGPRTDGNLDLRGRLIATTRPLLISSAGYGLWFTASSNYQFDLAKTSPDRASISASIPDRTEFFFHYGPSPKEILEENFAVAGTTFGPALAHGENFPSAAALPPYAIKGPALPFPELLNWLAHAAMSGITVAAFDRSQLDANNPAADLLPMLYGAPTSPLRRSLRPYLFTYLTEAKDRGFSLVRPMAMQYSKDTAAVTRLDQFMLGDEILVAAGPNVYLPMGLWTDLRTNQEHKGRQVIPVAKAEGVPALYARNGTIVPFERASDGVYELHYFPRLGAEFFFYEPGDPQPSQVHASPAAGVLRLEIESRVTRRYEWIVHHVSAPIGNEGHHHYDPATRTLRIPIAAQAMQGSIVNVTLTEPLE